MFNLRRILCGITLLLSAFMSGHGFAQKNDDSNWPLFPKPKIIHVTSDADLFPVAGRNDVGGVAGNLSAMVHSLAGLAALATSEGTASEMVWINLARNDSYRIWLDDVVKLSGARLEKDEEPWALARHFIKTGVVKGYILYQADLSSRTIYAEHSTEAPAYDCSINVATTAAPFLRGMLIEQSLEPKARELGLTCLLDARGKTEAWAFDTYSKSANRHVLHCIDPKISHCRDFSIATKSLCIFGQNAVSGRVMNWCEPNSPVIGWNEGDEYDQTLQMSRAGLFQTATNWSLNMPVLSCLRPPADLPWDRLRLNLRSSLFPLDLDWPQNTHYTAFVLTDGDNLQWYMGSFISNSLAYWSSPARGEFAMGWTAPVVGLAKTCLPALNYLAATQSPRDEFIVLGGEGYFYPEEYGADRKDEERKLLRSHIAQMRPYLEQMGVRVAMSNNFAWDSPRAKIGYEIFADEIPSLAGQLAIQYSPYNAGLGKMLWIKNAAGDPVPVISARYAIWGNQTQLPRNGPPALIASMINKAQYKGDPTSEDYFDWTTVHCWSYFREAKENPSLLGEEVEQSRAREPGVQRGIAPVLWAVRRLNPHVRVVSSEELIWRTRLALRTRETLAALARDYLADLSIPSALKMEITTYRIWLADAPLDTFAQKKDAIRRLRDVRLGKLHDPKNVIY
jgi:hypothetical protein